MPIILQHNDNLSLTKEEVELLWMQVLAHRQHHDDDVTVRCVSADEIQRLNREYRNKDTPTNVLTFSYGDATHDVALCVSVMTAEAKERGVSQRDYAALVLVHAFLHVVGMDHERSAEEAAATHEAEKIILRAAGFSAQIL